MIPENIINEIKEKADIVSVVSSYVPSLKKKGKNHLGLCPFHSEKTASFTVSQEKGLFHCFGCGEGGNLFSFIMKMEKVDFAEAVKIIGEKIGITVGAQDFAPSQNNKFYNLMEIACKFYESHLDEVNEYIDKRKIKNPKEFRLGYAPDGWDNLLNYLINKGAIAEDIERCGLILPRQSGSGFYDRFRNRLIFPIADQRGRIVGFGGRAVGGEEPKYLNSPDSVIFNKGENLYNLNAAKDFIKHQKFAVLVEGYMDVVGCFEAGLKNVLAPLGTSLTTKQAQLLSRFTDVAIIAFDSDSAGQLASERTQEILKEAGFDVRIASFPEAKDPDEFIKKFGSEKFFDSIKKSSPATEFKIRRIINRFNIKEAEGKSKAAHEIINILSLEKDKILKSEYVKLAAKLLNIGVEILIDEIQNQTTYKNKGYNLKRTTSKPNSKVKEAEKTLIRLILEWEDALPKIKDEFTLDNFTEYKDIFGLLWMKSASEISSLQEENKDSKILREIILSEEPIENKEEILTDCINAIKSFNIKSKMSELRNAMLLSEKEGKTEPLKSMNEEYLKLNEILRTLVR